MRKTFNTKIVSLIPTKPHISSIHNNFLTGNYDCCTENCHIIFIYYVLYTIGVNGLDIISLSHLFSPLSPPSSPHEFSTLHLETTPSLSKENHINYKRENNMCPRYDIQLDLLINRLNEFKID